MASNESWKKAARLQAGGTSYWRAFTARQAPLDSIPCVVDLTTSPLPAVPTQTDEHPRQSDSQRSSSPAAESVGGGGYRMIPVRMSMQRRMLNGSFSASVADSTPVPAMCVDTGSGAHLTGRIPRRPTSAHVPPVRSLHGSATLQPSAAMRPPLPPAHHELAEPTGRAVTEDAKAEVDDAGEALPGVWASAPAHQRATSKGRPVSGGSSEGAAVRCPSVKGSTAASSVLVQELAGLSLQEDHQRRAPKTPAGGGTLPEGPASVPLPPIPKGEYRDFSIDIECTGLQVTSSRILEIAAVDMETGRWAVNLHDLALSCLCLDGHIFLPRLLGNIKPH